MRTMCCLAVALMLSVATMTGLAQAKKDKGYDDDRDGGPVVVWPGEPAEKVPPGLAKKGGLPPGQAKKQGQGPPPWAPAYGYRAKHEYRYYPGAGIYYEPKAKRYYYQEGGVWVHAPKPPVQFSIPGLGSYTIIQSDEPEPWLKGR